MTAISTTDATIEGKKEFQSHVRTLLKAIDVCLKEKLHVPACMLIYAGIDGMAWLQLPQQTYNVGMSDFVKWVEKYFVVESPLPKSAQCSGMDLYAARCGLLHTGTPDSSQTRSGSGTARKLFYQIGDGQILIQVRMNEKRQPIIVDVRELARSFRIAIQRYQDQIDKDAALAELVFTRARDYLCEYHRVEDRPKRAQSRQIKRSRTKNRGQIGSPLQGTRKRSA